MKNNLFGYTLEKLQNELVLSEFKKFNATQIYEWIYQKRQLDFELMTNLSNPLKNHLEETFSLDLLPVITKQTSFDGTTKFLFKLVDGYSIETVLMTHDYGLSLCVTSQVGCSMGCTFCASGLKKKTRDLEVSELVSQVTSVEQLLGIKITHVVVMGTGEPFDNYDNVMEFIRVINENHGLAIGQRHITVSTCGIVPRIYQYAKEPIRSNLAISLHASNDDLRTRLMPINKRYPLKEIIQACKVYFEETSRRITFEYILLKGENDSIQHADELSDLLRGLNAYVNLIPYNVVQEFSHEKTDVSRAMAFYDRLTKRGIIATMRKEQGTDIDAACGQLRMKTDKE
ncbi:MAG: 23S rRNA (adenine(2503)-C(2))-methyltransferase RlmN [Candidatus Izemoplasmatales bacterium]|nr:23S rRNA (adenine(2503)-C(2))-methyltransferase RlmN [Candidatus Izemoplasmatales bacterium]